MSFTNLITKTQVMHVLLFVLLYSNSCHEWHDGVRQAITRSTLTI